MEVKCACRAARLLCLVIYGLLIFRDPLPTGIGDRCESAFVCFFSDIIWEFNALGSAFLRGTTIA